MRCTPDSSEGWARKARLRVTSVFCARRYMSLAVCELDRPGLGPLVAAACSDGAVRCKALVPNLFGTRGQFIFPQWVGAMDGDEIVLVLPAVHFLVWFLTGHKPILVCGAGAGAS